MARRVKSAWLLIAISGAIVLATFVVYWQLRGHEFLNYDDPMYVWENDYVRKGLTWEGVRWAFTATRGSTNYWHPLTWLSHMLDCQLFRTDPGWHHLTNFLLHLISTLLLFGVLNRMTGALWRSAFVAALFALHPLNVESVAWISERKSVLSTLFWMLTMAAYLRYVKHPAVSRYLLTLLVFALGLMAKPMLVTLPFVLLLLDYWPLGRFQPGQAVKDTNRQTHKFLNARSQRLSIYRLVREKIAFFALSAASIYISSLSVQSLGIVISTESVPIKLRIANALVSYINYIGKIIWPQKLAVFYPYPDMVPMWQSIGAFLLLVCISVLVIRLLRVIPYLAVGWLWYLGILIPAIGLVQAGVWPAIADRFVYVPSIGLFIIIAWAVPEVLAKWRYRKITLGVLAPVVLLALAVCSWFQGGYWRNGITLFEHALTVTDKNYVAYTNLGEELMKQGEIDAGIEHFRQALEFKPDYRSAHYNLGLALVKRGKVGEAIKHYKEALRLEPDAAPIHYNLGKAFMLQQKYAEAMKHYRKALQIKPDEPVLYYNLALVLVEQGEIDEAIKLFRKALRLKPDAGIVHRNLGLALARQGRYAEAIKHYEEALRIDPRDQQAREALKATLAKRGKR